MAGLPCKFYALIDGGARGNAIEIEQLEGSQAESDQHFRIEFRVRTGKKNSATSGRGESAIAARPEPAL